MVSAIIPVGLPIEIRPELVPAWRAAHVPGMMLVWRG